MTPLTYGSVFTGIAGFDLAFDRAGMTCRWQVEIDEQCHRVLERHYPATPRHHDIRDVGAHNLERVDIICGGWPCQDLSVAGQRAGLAGARSGLFYEAIRVIHELEPALVLLENVPGLISSHAGRDFAAVLLAFRELGARDICWRTLDAQYFGVPQRRRRIFLVADFAGERAAEILFESESMSGNPASRREAGQGIAASLTSGTATGRGVNRPGRRQEDDVNLAVCALSANGVGTCGADDNQAQAGHLVARSQTASNLRNDGDTENFVTHALTSEGSDASEDGTGRGAPIIPILEAGARQGTKADQRDGTGIGRPGDPMFSLQSSKQHAVAFAENQRGELRLSDVDTSLNQAGGKPGSGYPAAVGSFGVRRLTPTECSRLQGYPDGWCASDAEGSPISDSAQYRMLGNSVAVPVILWIAQRMKASIEVRA